MSRSFRIKYNIQSLETKSNPLFTHIQAYIVTDGIKRLISEAKEFENNHAYFQSFTEQKDKTLTFNPTTGNYYEAKVMFLFQFEAQQRYIKMGETCVNVADIVNNNKNGQLQSYKLEKCYDRNAKVWITVDYSLNQHKRLNKSAEIKHKQHHFHIKSHHDLPETKGRVNSIYQTNQDYTEFSVLQNFSLISQNKTSYNPTRSQNQRYTSGKTEVNRKAPQKLQYGQNLQESLALANTNLRLVQQQLNAVQQKYLEKSKLLDQAGKKLNECIKENEKLNQKLENSQKRLSKIQKSVDSQREAHMNEAQKYLKMYHQSQMQRNKLLIQVETERQKIRQKMRQIQKRSAQYLKKTKSAEKHQQLLKQDIKSCMLQIANFQRQYQQEKRARLKVQQELKQAVSQVKRLLQQIQSNKYQILNLKKENSQKNQQLQVSKLTIDQLLREKSQLKKETEKKQEIVQKFQMEIKKSNEVIKSQRLNYSRHLQQIQQNNELEQKNFEKYIEELQTKTINDYSKSNEAHQVKKELSKFKRWLAQEKERVAILQTQLQKVHQQNHILQFNLNNEKSHILELQKEKSQLQIELTELRQMQEQLDSPLKAEDQKATFERQQQLIEKCYLERDEFWKKQFEKLDQDTKIMIEKHRKQKEALNSKAKANEKQLNENYKQIQQSKLKVTKLEELQSKQNRQIKQLHSKIANFENIIKEYESQISVQQAKLNELVQTKKLVQELELSFSQTDKRLTLRTKEMFTLKTQLEKEKDLKAKYSIQVKEMVTILSNLLGKSQKYQIFYDQIRLQFVQTQTLLLLNSTLKLFAEKHNRIRLKIEKSQALQAELDQKQKKIQKNGPNFSFQRRLSTSSRNSNQSQLREDQQLFSSSKLNDSKILNLVQKRQENEVVLTLIKQQCSQLKSRLQRQKSRNIQLEKQVQRLHQTIEEQRKSHSKTKESLDTKAEQVEIYVEKCNKAQKNVNSAKQQARMIAMQLQTTKIQFQNYQKAYKIDKTQQIRKNQSTKVLLPKAHDDSFYKILELQKRIHQSEEEVEKLRKEKEDRRNDGLYNKQIKNFELKLKQNDSTIISLKKQIQQQKKNNDQQKEIYNIRLKKVKQNLQQEIGNHIKQKGQIKANLEAQQNRCKQLSRQNKSLEQSLKKLNAQLSNNAEKDERNKKMIASEWQLKMKSLQTQHDNELTIMKRQMQQQRFVQKSLKENIQKKQKEIKQLKDEIDKKGKQIQNLISQCQIYGIRIKSLEQEEGLYKQTIEVLEKKFFESSESSKKNNERQVQNSDLRSNFSLKAYTFR